MAERVLIVAAHPDDEVLGVGGTAARHVLEGDRVWAYVVAEGATSRDPHRDSAARRDELAALHEAAHAAGAVLGLAETRFGGLPDNRLDALDLLDVVKTIESVVAELAPSIVYTHHFGDLNVDHAVVHRAVLTACRPLPGATVQRIATFETVSSTEWGLTDRTFRPTCFVDISATLERKRRALQAYAREMRPFPHARSWENIEALARIRGASSGLAAAEAFALVRETR